MASEGLTFDEGPYGEYTGMYGGGLKHNYRLKVKAMTFARAHLPARHNRRNAPVVY